MPPVTVEPTELHTARLLLRPPRQEDLEDELAIANDPEFAFYGRRDPVTRGSVAEGLARRLATPWSDRPEFVLVFEGRVAGNVQLEIDHANLIAELGYGIAREQWRKGLMTEAARAVIDYGFTTFGLAKIFARADPRNIASVRVLEKLGMTREGLLRKHLIRRGERVDRVYYGLLREEWETPASVIK